MTPPERTRIPRRLVLGMALLGLLGGLVPVPVASAATDRLPDLRVAPISDFHLVTSGGRRLLRFTGLMWNNGAGPLEVRSNRTSSSSSKWIVDQIVYDSLGDFRRIRTAAGLQYAGDGHDHWHVRSMLTYHLWGTTTATLRSSKIGFCFFDTNLMSASLARSPSHRIYLESSCGKKASTSARNGISVGWGDKYPWDFAYQWIDVTGLPAGVYTLRSAVDLYGYFAERSETNNCAWARIRIAATGSAVTVVARGQTCINDTTGSPYAADIAWARETGISSGCDADMFCTNGPVSRGLAARFVARAFDYPAATTDAFTDDDASPYEADIDRIAEAGIATRCAVGRYCPDKTLTRGVAAYMLARALHLPPATQDYFDDDAGSILEGPINQLAEAGLVTGCSVRRYCPAGAVTRGQLISMLHHSLVPTS